MLVGSYVCFHVASVIVTIIVRPVGSSAPPPPNGGGYGGPSSSGGGLFSNINFAAPVSAAAAPPSSSSKPKFALPTLSEDSQKTGPAGAQSKNPFGNINLAPSNAGGNKATGPVSDSTKFSQKFQEWAQTCSLDEVHGLAMKRYLTTAIALLESEKDQKKKDTTASASSTSTGPPTGSTVATSSTAAPKSLFPSSSSPAPVAFAFGSTAPQASPAAAPASQPTFAFGSTSATAAAPSPAASSGFSFAPAAVSAAPTPGANVKISLTPVPTHSESGSGDVDDTQLAPEEKTELESADGDWNELMNVKVRAYHYRHEGGPKKFASGGLKIQQLKANPKIHRMVLRDAAGKVLLNIGISTGMSFQKVDQKTKPGSRPAAVIIFFGINDQERGVEKFSLVSTLDDATKLLEKFQQLSK